jgi:type II secretory ATPase GspE/PulE/Tfp pilus assembly ATPase PilB-like protein
VCDSCAKPDKPDHALLRRFDLHAADSSSFRRGAGCARCSGAGYKGRIGVYEVLAFAPGVQRAVESSTSPVALREAALDAGMRPMWRDGAEKAAMGLTTLEEVAKAAASGETESGAPCVQHSARAAA